MTLFPGTTFSHRNIVPCLLLAFLQSKSYYTNTNIERIDVIPGEKASGESTFGRIDLIPYQLGVFILSTSLSITLFEYLTCEIPLRPGSWRDSLHITPLSSVIQFLTVCAVWKCNSAVKFSMNSSFCEMKLLPRVSRTQVFSIQVVLRRTQAVKLHKNIFHLVQFSREQEKHFGWIFFVL